jgi:hypothetical protein
VLYKMLTGRRPFGGDDVSDTLASVLKDTPDWDALPRDLPASWRRVRRARPSRRAPRDRARIA